MALRSPAKISACGDPPPCHGMDQRLFPLACGSAPSLRKSVLPPRKKSLPQKRCAPGSAFTKPLSKVRPAFTFDANISLETGTYLVAPVVVPDDNAKYGTGSGHVAPATCGWHG